MVSPSAALPALDEAIKEKDSMVIVPSTAVETMGVEPGEESQTRADLGAATTDLRYTSGYLFNLPSAARLAAQLEPSLYRIAGG